VQAFVERNAAGRKLFAAKPISDGEFRTYFGDGYALPSQAGTTSGSAL